MRRTLCGEVTRRLVGALGLAALALALPSAATADHKGPIPVGVPLTCEPAGHDPNGLPIYYNADYHVFCTIPPPLGVTGAVSSASATAARIEALVEAPDGTAWRLPMTSSTLTVRRADGSAYVEHGDAFVLSESIPRVRADAGQLVRFRLNLDAKEVVVSYGQDEDRHDARLPPARLVEWRLPRSGEYAVTLTVTSSTTSSDGATVTSSANFLFHIVPPSLPARSCVPPFVRFRGVDYGRAVFPGAGARLRSAGRLRGAVRVIPGCPMTDVFVGDESPFAPIATTVVPVRARRLQGISPRAAIGVLHGNPHAVRELYVAVDRCVDAPTQSALLSCLRRGR